MYAARRWAAANNLARVTTPEVVAPPPGNPRFPLVDSLRAIAALSVIAGHLLLAAFGTRVAGIFGGLGSGVAIFFVVSGFLLYRPYVAARLAGTKGPRLRDYARRRALRIVPAYWLALTVLALYPGLVADFGRDGWVYYGLLQDWFPDLRTNGLPQAWSMTVEVTFYVLLPLFGALAWRLTRGLRLASPVNGELAVIAALVVMRFAYQPFHTLALEPLVYYLDWFLYGMLMAVVSASIDHTGARPRAIAAIEHHPNLCWLAAFGVYAIFAVRLADHAPTFGDHLLQGLFAGLVLLPAVFVGSGHGAARSVLRNRVLAWLGLISYGLYLWHFPIITELSHASFITELPFGKLATLTLISVAITVACAAASYYLLERPLLRFKRTRPARALPARQAA